eukprot:TRINITY_DN7062_c1_g2_i1.p1 TRINITY_DN7062_c1_g2~~TRINITY_DN7062_c1_g2_i1.p1  ORF type:complete len:473 (-),score=149.89 TRINITY_DN7062_c1_g2_i1:113-1531(-)
MMLFVVAIALVFSSSCLGQPYNNVNGNSQGSAFVSEQPLTAAQASGIRLRWSVSNVSKLLAPLNPDLAGQFHAFGNILSPDSSTMVLLAARPGHHCFYTDPCSLCHLVTVDVRTGKARAMTAENVSFSIEDSEGSCVSDTLLWAYPQNVYVAADPLSATRSTLSAFHAGTLAPRWKLELDGCSQLGSWPINLLENRDGTMVYFVTACAVHAVSTATGAAAWQLTLPINGTSDDSYATSYSFLWAPAQNSPSDTMLVVAYTAWETTAATIGVRLSDGKILWSQPYFPSNDGQGTTEANPSMGGSQLVFSQAETFYTLGVAAIDVTNGGKPSWVFYETINHNDVWSNFATSPDDVTAFVFGDDSDWANPLFVVDSTGRNRSMYVNGTDDFSGAECQQLFLVGPGKATALYGFCGPAVFGVNTEKMAVTWSFRLDQSPAGYWETFMYLGNGTFVVNADNRNDWENQWLRKLDVYF